MKHLFKITLLSFALVFFASCEDDDSSNDTSADLVGTWSMTSLDYDGTSSTTFQGTTTSIDFIGEGTNIDYTLTFDENPNNFDASGSYDIELTTDFMGQTTTQTESVEDANSTGTWSRDGNTLSFDGVLVSLGDMAPMTGDTENNDITISELTATTLVLTQDVMQVESQDGFEVEVTLSTEIVFSRL